MRTRIPISALLVSLAIIFSYIEVLIPFNFFIPGFKLGIANLVILVALYMLGPWYAMVINVIRIVLAGVLFTGLGSLMFSLTGGVFAVVAMILLKKAGPFSIVGVSIGGAASHNIGQLIVAGFVIENMKILVYLPLLLVVAVITGTIMGILGTIIIKRLPSKKLATTTVVLLLCLTLSSCSIGDNSQPVSKNDFMLDTVCTITIYGMNESVSESIIDDAFRLCKSYENQLSKTVHTSEVAKINHAKGETTKVSSKAAFVIGKGLQYSKVNDSFDITIGNVSRLWNFGDEEEIPKLPNDSEIKEALKTVDHNNVDVLVAKEPYSSGDYYITLKNPSTQIDLGGIAKGYIADEVADFLRDRMVRSALINFGGNVVTVGEKPNDNPWIIGIENPNYKNENDDPVLGQLQVSGDTSVVTAGIYQRAFEIDGINYHHILDPKTGYPVNTDLSSATIIAEKSIDGDAISTMCILWGHDKAYEYLEGQGIKGVLVKTDGKITVLPGTNISYK